LSQWDISQISRAFGVRRLSGESRKDIFDV